MKRISGYDILDVVEDSRFKKLLRVEKPGEPEKRIAAILKAPGPSAAERMRFQQIAGALQGTAAPELIRILEVRHHENGYALILEDFGGIPLTALLEQGPPGPDITLRLALSFSAVLGRLHGNHIVHGAVRPEYVYVNSRRDGVRLLPLGFLDILTHEMEDIYHPEVIRRILPYLSPEQTGRMNRKVDHRTDFYSLGILLYEILTGAPPFLSSDPVEIIHAHLARKPPPPVKLQNSVPPVVSDLIMKLISKAPEDRYQSSQGLAADLRKCLAALQKNGSAAPFRLGAEDIAVRFGEPPDMVGRGEETASIRQALEGALQGRCESVFISGPPGIGKSKLVMEWQREVIQRGGLFLWGKFEPFRRDIPCGAIVQAFQALLRRLISEGGGHDRELRERIIAAVGPDMPVLQEILPEIRLIVGDFPEVPRMHPADIRNRFHPVMNAFTRLFAVESHPLVLFLDDLQWADPASLLLIRQLLMDSAVPYFLLIGAYRNNHAHEIEALAALIADILQSGARMTPIRLGPLPAREVDALIARLLGCPAESVMPLAGLIYGKTYGNPFFIQQFIQLLYREGLMTIDPVNGWQWDLELIRRKRVTDNVIDLMVTNISNLRKEVKEALTICACIGYRFDVETVAAALDRPGDETAQLLDEAAREGLIDNLDGVCVFHHDRILEVAYGLIPEERKPGLHYRIGRLLLKKLPVEDSADAVFQTVGQLNLGMSLMTDQQERDELAGLNLRAGKNAKTAAAYDAAQRYFSIGISLLGPDGWRRQYALCLSLFDEAAETAYLSTAYEKLERFTAETIRRARCLEDTIRACEVCIRSSMARNRLKEAVETGLQLLSRMGVRFPEKPSVRSVFSGLLHTRLALYGKTIEELADKPRMTDAGLLAMLRIMESISTAVYYSRPSLLPLLVTKMTRLSIRYGISPGSPYHYAAYGLILCSAGNIEAGFRFGQLAMALQGRLKTSVHPAKTGLVVNGFILHWKIHAENGLPQLLAVYRTGIGSGDSEFAAHALMLYCWSAFQVRMNLEEIDLEIEGHVETLRSMKQESQLQLALMCRQTVQNLLRAEKTPGRLNGDVYSEDRMLPRHEEAGDRTAVCSLQFAKLFLNYLHGAYGQAVCCAEKGARDLHSLNGLLVYANFHFYEALARLALVDAAPLAGGRSVPKQVGRIRKRLRHWARHAPMNFQHKYDLVTAEFLRVRGRNQRAEEKYRQAIEGAHHNEFLHEEALALELAAKFHRSRGTHSLADIYMAAARDKYAQWGATAKARQLESAYPDIFMRPLPPHSAVLPGSLDYMTVVKALQAISTEIILEQLIEKLLTIMLEIAGADRAVFLIVKEDRFLYEAERRIMDETAPHGGGTVIRREMGEPSGPLLMPAILQVKRTGTFLLIDDAGGHPLYSADPYIQKHRPRSILCLPVIRQGKLIGLLYLENSETAGVFQGERVGILQLLSSQAAISLENALLYQNLLEAEEKVQQLNADLEQRVIRRTAELRESLEALQNAQHQLVQSEKMAALGGLVAGIAHEINTPLGIGVTAATFLRDKTENYVRKFTRGELSAADFRKYADTAMEAASIIHTNLNRAGELINSFKNVAVDQTHEEKRDFRLITCIEDILNSLRPKLKKTAHRVKVDCPENLKINSYPGVLSQIITNLVMNSLLHGFDGMPAGEIVLAVREEEMSLVMEYRDNGRGMNRETLGKIFDPFFTTKRNQGGTGLGMHILYNLVTQSLKGDIQVKSEPNQGVDIVIRFPRGESPPAARKAAG
ncbi:MAG: trifunctional serine/threonine-protein kinase/ATP-binding protein/sensor histidine kinase [Thermodesulfobacteriota bacterium]